MYYEKIKINSTLLNKLINLLNSEIQIIKPNYDLNLSELHNFVAFSEINYLRLFLFNKLNEQNYLYKELISHKSILEKIKSILGPDLLIQTKINLSIQMPNDESSTLDIHSDCWSGDTPFQINLWIPLTDAYSTNSMFLIDYLRSKVCIDTVKEKEFKDIITYINIDDYIDCELNQAIIFNPGLIHGNTINKTDKTRLSLNIRFKSLFTPDSKPEHISRAAGIYYESLTLSEWTKLAIDIDTLNN